MTFQELQALCALQMVSDPYPLKAEEQAIIQALLNRESINFGFANWVETYHAPADARDALTGEA